jgi:transmembrane sensor
LAWQEGRIVFDATPLLAAVEQVNRFTDRPIRLADPALQSVKVSGSFSTREIPVFLRSLEQGFNLNVEQRAEAVLISAASRR